MRTIIVLILVSIMGACAVVDTVRTGIENDIDGLQSEFVRVFNRKEN
jgi:hypothetical protein